MNIHFPSPYPDELLYSVIARYHIRVGNIFWKHTLDDVFGYRTVRASVFLPSGINAIIDRLPENTTLTVEWLIQDHTMYPFYTAFLPPERTQKIYTAMKSRNGAGIYAQAGVMASNVPQNTFLKYCPQCFEEDLEHYGELYWHRQHQLPGELICAKHNVYLENSIITVQQNNKHAFIAASTENCNLGIERKVESDYQPLYREFILKLNQWWLKSHVRRSYDYYSKMYQQLLWNKGYANHNGTVKQNELQQALYNFYPGDFLEKLHINNHSKWIEGITRKHRKSFHPYYHTLLINFLNRDLNTVIKPTPLSYHPFGTPKWPCLNKYCSKFNKDVIEEITFRNCEETKKPIGRFTCDLCGFSYTRKGGDRTSEDRFSYSKIMDYGWVWRKRLANLLNQGLSYRETARQLGVDPTTVIKHAEKLNNIREKNDEKRLINSHRNNWIQAQKQYPSKSKTEIRKIEPAAFSYLYRHDQEWLNSHSPKNRANIPSSKRVNWKKRDQEVLMIAISAAEQLRSRKKLKKITHKAVSNEVGLTAMLEKHLDKMPETKKYLDKVVESDRDFRARRVIHALNEIKEKGGVVKHWAVFRAAGIRKEYYAEAEEVLNKHSF